MDVVLDFEGVSFVVHYVFLDVFADRGFPKQTVGFLNQFQETSLVPFSLKRGQGHGRSTKLPSKTV